MIPSHGNPASNSSTQAQGGTARERSMRRLRRQVRLLPMSACNVKRRPAGRETMRQRRTVANSS